MIKFNEIMLIVGVALPSPCSGSRTPPKGGNQEKIGEI